jgi:hypothetical protein
LLAGRQICRLRSYFDKVLKQQQVDTVPRQLTRVVQSWTHDRLASLGVNVMRREDCISVWHLRSVPQIMMQATEQLDSGNGYNTWPAQPPGVKPLQPDEPGAPRRVRHSRRTGT